MQKYTKKGTNMNRKELSQNHWKYYLMLEKRFVESIEFVELHEDNFDAFSNGYLKKNILGKPGGRRKDVIVWRGETGDNIHCTTNLNINTWETAKS